MNLLDGLTPEVAASFLKSAFLLSAGRGDRFSVDYGRQGVSSFYAAIGDRDLADTVLQNFRQTICFRTEDRATIERMNFLLGAVDVARISENVGSSTTTGHGGSSSIAGYGLSLQRQNVITPQLFRQLRQNDALALLSIGGNAYDDVLTMPPVFIQAT
jgi:type IV secretory pathway TraG/TraD family ATPase VirD4